MSMSDLKWVNNPEHDHLYELSSDLTAKLQREFDTLDLRVQCGYEDRVGYHFRIHGVETDMIGKVSDRARDWLSSTTPYRFELQVDDL